MKHLNKYLLTLVCILAIGSLTGCGRKTTQTEKATERSTAVTTEKYTTAATETETMTNKTTETNRTDTTEKTTNNTTTTEGVLEELGDDVKRGVEDVGEGVKNVGEDILGTERTTTTETYRDGTETITNK